MSYVRGFTATPWTFFCLRSAAESGIRRSQLTPQPKNGTEGQNKASAGITRLWTTSGPYEWIARLSWSPDGREIATASQRQGIHIWEARSGKLRLKIPIERYHVFAAEWSPDGTTLVSSQDDRFIRFWNAKNGEPVREIEAYSLEEANILEARHREQYERFRDERKANADPKAPRESEQLPLLAPTYNSVHDVKYSPSGDRLAWADEFGVRVRDISDDGPSTLFREQDQALSVAWSPNERFLAATSYNRTLCIFDIKKMELRHRITASYGPGLAWSPDGALVVAALGVDIGVWNAESGQLLRVLEAHTSRPRALAFSADGELLSSKGSTMRPEAVRQGSRGQTQRVPDKRVLIWRTDTWNVCGSLVANPGGYLHAGIAFSPTSALIATSTATDRALQLWSFDKKRLFKAPPPPSAVYYRNAKVALIGDSGVGKSGLALVLSGRPFAPTDSTHARKVKLLKTERVRVANSAKELREIVLWDLAGQPGYRIIHQLHLEDISVAAIVFDSKSELDPFAGVRHWNRAFLQAKRFGSKPKGAKILVAARVDRGSIGLSTGRLEALLRELDIRDYVATSAKEGIGIAELKTKIEEAIDWEALPAVTSNLLFQEIKSFIATEKSRGKILATISELRDAFVLRKGMSRGTSPSTSDFETCIGRLQSLGLVRLFSFGNLALLRPEVLDSYASAMIFAAKNEPDGMGSILEDDVRNGKFFVLEDERLKEKEQERLLLLATTEDLIAHEIALREPAEDGQLLVLPSQLTRENPELPDPPGKDTIFEFQGPIPSIYATLVVRLAHSNIFRTREMWRNAATFDSKPDKMCGLYLTELEEGRGTLTLFYESGIADTSRAQFEDYVYSHVSRRAVPNSVKRRKILTCPDSTCATAISDAAANKRKERGFDWIACNVCGETIKLEEPAAGGTASLRASSRDIDRAAVTRKTLDAALVSASAEMQTTGFTKWAGADRTTLALVFTDVVGSTLLGDQVGDEEMSDIRHAHFGKARELVAKHKGYEIKTIGDSFMVALRTAVQGLSFALELHSSTGHEKVRIRAGVHVGPVQVEEEDAFGGMVNYAARVVGHAKGAEIWLSDRAYQDVQSERARAHAGLVWTQHPNCELKGFRGTHTLWSAVSPIGRD
jgi:WD40 repeat protein/class 3 adenylate cyclase